MGGLQPQLLPELLRQEQRWRAQGPTGAVQDGFIDRFLFVYPQAKVPGWTEATVPEGLRRGFHQLVVLLFRLQPQTLQPRLQPVAVGLDDAARTRFADWMQANTVEANALLEQGSPLAGPWAKLPQQLAWPGAGKLRHDGLWEPFVGFAGLGSVVGRMQGAAGWCRVRTRRAKSAS